MWKTRFYSDSAINHRNLGSHLPMNDSDYMELAFAAAQRARELGEIPVGAVIVHNGEVIATAHNRRELDQDSTAHAEMIAIRAAAEVLGSWRMIGASLYVTLEPCTMCAGALVLARVDRLVFGCRDPKAGAVRSLFEIVEDERLNHRVEVVEGVSKDRCSALLTEFFAGIRARKKKEQ